MAATNKALAIYDWRKIKAWIAEGYSGRQIAALCGVGEKALFCALSRRGLKLIKHTRAKEKNPRWKGGRKKVDSGHVKVKAPEHPYRDRNGYVFEHRLVMEKHLGRVLGPKEVVHHIDGDKLNNRIENLMLFYNNKLHIKWHVEHDPAFRVKRTKEEQDAVDTVPW